MTIAMLPRRIAVSAGWITFIVAGPTVAAQQTAAVDTALAYDIRQQLFVWTADPDIRSAFRGGSIDLDISKAEFKDDTSAVVPGLRYRWTAYGVSPVVTSPHFFSVAGVDAAGTYLIIRRADEWGAIAGTWYARGPAEAKSACLEMFRSVMHEAWLPLYSLYEHQPGFFEGLNSSDREILLQRARRGSESRMLENPARWETDVWIVLRHSSMFARRVRCTVPRQHAAPPSAFSVRVLYALPRRRSSLL
jgi:hypothetical protein